MSLCSEQSLAFDDVLLEPQYSEVLPSQVLTDTYFTPQIPLKIPLISAAMDTVTESQLAIAMATYGGIGVIHKNLSIDEQAYQVQKVKTYESGMVVNPITIDVNATLTDALKIMSHYRYSGIPVVDKLGKLVGILTNRDVRFADNPKQPISELMTKTKLITVSPDVTKEEAKRLLHRHRIEKLLVVDENYHCIGLITVKDMEKSEQFPLATKDDLGRLRVAAAVGTGKDGIKRASVLIDAGVDAIVIDTAHGHSKSVIDTVKEFRRIFPSHPLIAGNVATASGASALIEAGVDAVKVGIGPGSICTTRIVAGVGIPQLSAIINVAARCKDSKVCVIADGGIKFSGDVAKAIAAGADTVMIGSLLAGTEESPGEIVLYQGRSYKTYRGMGSVSAMSQGSADRYFQSATTASKKLVPEGVEGRVPSSGPVSGVIHQLIGGLRASMGYTGNKSIAQMKTNCKFTGITNAGLKESHAHDITITREAPNYHIDEG